MPITIIKGGKNEFIGHCNWCGCDFRYTNDCISNDDKVRCPFCNRSITHHGEFGTSAVDNTRPWLGYYNSRQAAQNISVELNQQMAMARGK